MRYDFQRTIPLLRRQNRLIHLMFRLDSIHILLSLRQFATVYHGISIAGEFSNVWSRTLGLERAAERPTNS